MNETTILKILLLDRIEMESIPLSACRNYYRYQIKGHFSSSVQSTQSRLHPTVSLTPGTGLMAQSENIEPHIDNGRCYQTGRLKWPDVLVPL